MILLELKAIAARGRSKDDCCIVLELKAIAARGRSKDADTTVNTMSVM
jgi:hypothetical protein